MTIDNDPQDQRQEISVEYPKNIPDMSVLVKSFISDE